MHQRTGLALILFLVVTTCFAENKKQRREAGVFPAAPERISFERVAPLLDGLYEDVAAIQLTPLQLTAINANGTKSFAGSYGRCLYKVALIASGVLVPIRIV